MIGNTGIDPDEQSSGGREYHTIYWYFFALSAQIRDLVVLTMLPRAIAFYAILFGLFGTPTPAEDVQKTADGMLDRARQLSDIRSPNAPGFRLNATFSFIGRDLETSTGTYSEVWMSTSEWRRETTVGNIRRIEIGGPTRRWLVDTSKDFPDEAARISSLLQMFPPPSAATFEFESFTAPDAATQCAVTKAAGEKHARHAFCFDTDKHVLVESVAPEAVGVRIADYSCSYSRFEKFGDYWFPREMVCFLDGHRKMELKVLELLSAPASDAALFTPPPGAVEIGNCSQNAVPPKAITTPNPMFPLGTRDRPTSVVLWVVVDIQGKPQEVKVSRSGGKQLDESALSVIRGWRFKPGTCNGEPMPMPINVEFRSSGYR
jgi:TonB family protein